MCDQCQAVMINRVACHETGCPDSWKHPKTGEPLVRKCLLCYGDFTPEEKSCAFCSRACEDDYYGSDVYCEDEEGRDN